MEATGIEPHFLSGVLKPDLSVTVFGSMLPFPIIVAPMAITAAIEANTGHIRKRLLNSSFCQRFGK